MREKGKNLKFLATLLLQFLIIVVIFIIEVSYGGQKMRLYSQAFKDGDRIPLKYVMPLAGGQNVSPPLTWEGVPSEAKSLVLLCYDPHPVAKNWVHWIVINIPPEVTGLPEGASTKAMPKGAVELKNSFGFVGYGGPQPPPGTGDHPYVFVLFALSQKTVKLPDKPSYDQIISVIKPYVIAEAKITGYFGR
jgi:Raf kinase inhibitor-like YbhB/YbcL family protein